MGFFVLISAILWIMGWIMRAPLQMRFAMIGMLYVGILIAQIVLPEGNPVRLAIGGTPGEWLVAGGAIALIWGYVRGLRWLRGRNKTPEPTPANGGGFSEAELERYARQIVLREIGGPGQKALREARVLVIGAGGLGSPALLYLGAAGVGTIGVIDGDVVDNSNLQRQVIHRDADIGMPKVFSAERAIREQNPHVTVRPYNRRLTEDIADALVEEYDVVLDGSDNFETRYLINRVCAERGVPLVAAALTQWEGQISVYDPANGTPCYQCVFPEAPARHLVPSCAEAGVLGPLPGVIGAMMAVEAIKVVTGAGAALRSKMLIYDALYSDTRQFSLHPRPDCPVCHPQPGSTGEDKSKEDVLQGGGSGAE